MIYHVSRCRRLVRALDPEYARKIDRSRFVVEVRRRVWIGAALRLVEERS